MASPGKSAPRAARLAAGSPQAAAKAITRAAVASHVVRALAAARSEPDVAALTLRGAALRAALDAVRRVAEAGRECRALELRLPLSRQEPFLSLEDFAVVAEAVAVGTPWVRRLTLEAVSTPDGDVLSRRCCRLLLGLVHATAVTELTLSDSVSLGDADRAKVEAALEAKRRKLSHRGPVARAVQARPVDPSRRAALLAEETEGRLLVLRAFATDRRDLFAAHLRSAPM